jgi:hypothetical protein
MIEPAPALDERFLPLGLISWSKARPCRVCGVEESSIRLQTMTVASGGMVRNSSINSETVICRCVCRPWPRRDPAKKLRQRGYVRDAEIFKEHAGAGLL